jgi:diacylglycerol kinase family enzyme
MAILPGGTANLMPVELGIPRHLARAAQIAAHEDSIPRLVDVVDNAGNMGLPGLSHAPDVSVSDGVLDVFALRAVRPAAPARQRSRARQRAAGAEIAQHWKAREISISTDLLLQIQGDGEMWGTTLITSSVQPGAVRVLTRSSSNRR